MGLRFVLIAGRSVSHLAHPTSPYLSGLRPVLKSRGIFWRIRSPRSESVSAVFFVADLLILPAGVLLMSPLLLLAAPVIVATMITMAACILAGRSERSLDDLALEEEIYELQMRRRSVPTEPASVPVRFTARPD